MPSLRGFSDPHTPQGAAIIRYRITAQRSGGRSPLSGTATITIGTTPIEALSTNAPAAIQSSARLAA